MRHEIFCFLLGVIVASIAFVTTIVLHNADADAGYLADLKRGRIILEQSQSELTREGLAHQLTRDALDRASDQLDGSLRELRRIREIQDQDRESIDGSLRGVERIRAIIQSLPVLGGD